MLKYISLANIFNDSYLVATWIYTSNLQACRRKTTQSIMSKIMPSGLTLGVQTVWNVLFAPEMYAYMYWIVLICLRFQISFDRWPCWITIRLVDHQNPFSKRLVLTHICVKKIIKNFTVISRLNFLA